jgi:hypothetical protein
MNQKGIMLGASKEENSSNCNSLSIDDPEAVGLPPLRLRICISK